MYSQYDFLAFLANHALQGCGKTKIKRLAMSAGKESFQCSGHPVLLTGQLSKNPHMKNLNPDLVGTGFHTVLLSIFPHATHDCVLQRPSSWRG